MTLTNVLPQTRRGTPSNMVLKVSECERLNISTDYYLYMLCGSIFFFGLKIYKPVSFLFSFVSDDGNGSETKESKYKIGLKIFNPPPKKKKNWNHNAYFIYYRFIS